MPCDESISRSSALVCLLSDMSFTGLQRLRANLSKGIVKHQEKGRGGGQKLDRSSRQLSRSHIFSEKGSMCVSFIFLEDGQLIRTFQIHGSILCALRKY